MEKSDPADAKARNSASGIPTTMHASRVEHGSPPLKTGSPWSTDLLRLQAWAGNKAVVQRLSGLSERRARKPIGGDSRALQRITIYVAPENPGEPARTIAINDYHFLYRLHLASHMSSTSSINSHDVIIEDFNDFNGLVQVATSRPNAQNFEFGGYVWGWRGPKEIYPVADNKKCFTMSGDVIEFLIGAVREGSTEIPHRLKEQKIGNQSLAGLLKEKASLLQGRVSSDAEEFKTAEQFPLAFRLPYRFTPKRLKEETPLWYKPGKGGNQGFIFPNRDRENGAHLHIKLDVRPDDLSLEHQISSIVCLTTRKSQNHFYPDRGKDGEWGENPSQNDRDDFIALRAMLELLNRYRLVASSTQTKPLFRTPEQVAEFADVDVSIVKAFIDTQVAEARARHVQAVELEATDGGGESADEHHENVKESKQEADETSDFDEKVCRLEALRYLAELEDAEEIRSYLLLCWETTPRSSDSNANSSGAKSKTRRRGKGHGK